MFCQCVKIVFKYSDLTELSRHKNKRGVILHIYATIALFLVILIPFQCSSEVVPSPLGVVDIWKRISGLMTEPPADHIYINFKVSLCVTIDWHPIWRIKKKKKIHSNSTKTIREVSCWCRFKNNDIQWAGKLFFSFSWARSCSLGTCSSIVILLKYLPGCGSFSHFRPP